MASHIQNLIDSGANVVLQINASELKSFLSDLLIQTEKCETEKDDEKYLTTPQVSDLLKVNKATLWRWNKSDYLKPVEIGGKRLYKQSDIDKLMGGGR